MQRYIQVLRFFQIIMTLSLATPTVADPLACDTTDTSTSPVEVPGLSEPGFGRIFYGSEKLAVLIPADGHWPVQSAEREFSDKLWWWRKGYVWTEETSPELTVTARRLDAHAPEVRVDWTTNALVAEDVSLMLNGLGFPTPGCWEVTGTYHDTSLTFVTLVGGRESQD
jgi:hypothetical protein